MRVLTVNTGSSSLKTGLYDLAEEPVALFTCTADAIGAASSRLRIRGREGTAALDSDASLRSHDAALTAFLEWLGQRGEAGRFDGAGHRIVVGSGEFLAPRRLASPALARLAALVPLAPDHLPQALAAIAAVEDAHPGMPQATCSDSFFHRSLPAAARLLPLPREWRERGVARWGFHGLSCESALRALRRLDPAAAAGRLVVAHLGSGASLTAIRGGQSVDTTMGLTPAGGLLMSSRSGDLDPGILIYLQSSQGLETSALNRLLNHESGLVGLSGSSGDMRFLLSQSDRQPAAAQAVACFVWQARKFLAAMAATLGGIETLIFTGGIGEHAPVIRDGICRDMEWMGIRLSPEHNRASAPVISAPEAAVTVRVIAADEDREIARHTAAALAADIGG